MSLVRLALRNVRRNRLRTVLTVLATAAGVLTYVLLQTVLSSWRLAADNAARDRIVTRHKLSFFVPLPRSYVDPLREIPGIKAATFATWFGGKLASKPEATFASFAVDERSFFQVYSELELRPEQRANWIEDRQGAVIGDQAAEALGLKLGDRVTMTGTIYPGEWTFNVDGIYHSTRRSTDRSWVLFHWDYLNQAVDPRQRDQIGWLVSQVADAAQGPAVTRAIDHALGTRDVPTTSLSERAVNLSYLAGASVILETISTISLIILALLMLVVASTISMSVRERTHEYGVMRSIGFTRHRVAFSVVAEGLALGLAGALLGLGLSVPIVQKALGTFIEENMSHIFPYFRIAPATAAMAVLNPTVLAALASLLPAYWVSRLSVVDSLRRAD